MTTIDPCTSTLISIAPATVENLVTFAGYNITSLVKYSFNDSVSFVRTLTTDTVDLCGEKILKFSVNNTATTVINATNKDYIYFSPPANTADFGVGSAKVFA